MRYLRQLAIILAITVAGELLHGLIPLPVPASIYGMLMMIVLLRTGLLKLEHVAETADFLVAIMAVMFIAPAVGLMPAWPQLRPVLIPVLVISVVTTLVVMVATGWTTQALVRRGAPTSAPNAAQDHGPVAEDVA